ncbi:hypothetical protein R3P38DRAFT_3312187 [Favolaschia claudopus]|uniref:Uncharacterized protein n=1 Tax=Favolaschia claudopus TaxID=2862362 RepID=A0AAW0C9S0_9AGAR
MVRIDETHEALARIQMNVDNYDKFQAQVAAENSDDSVDEKPIDEQSNAHWAFGAPVPGRLVNSRALEELNRGSPLLINFDFRLRQFISKSFPDELISYEDTIMIRAFKCPYVEYQLLGAPETFSYATRCSRRARGIVNITEPGLHFARLRALFRCSLPSGRKLDVALVSMFTQSRWKPRTRWAGCQIRDGEQQFSFLALS